MINQCERILDVEELSKWFPEKRSFTDLLTKKPASVLRAVNRVSFHINKGENVGLVGESGCGKSTLAKSLIRVYEPTDGRVHLMGQDITHLKGKALREIRPNMQMIFQDPYSSLNPRMTVYEIIAEVLSVHNIVPAKEVRSRVIELLEMCGLSEDVVERFPGQFSGGQRQRISIARALALNPAFIIADEPVSALDVSIQAQIINLLATLQKDLDLTVLFISHDLRVVQHITHRIMVMYLGSIVELGDTQEIFAQPAHPYTKVLTLAASKLDPTNRTREYVIEEELPSPINTPPGCKFHPRCAYCQERCKVEVPELREIAPRRLCACHYPLV